MISILIDGELNPAIEQDPRLSQSQVEAAVKAATADPQAGIVGIDSRMRPVITCRIHGKRTQYAVLRNGAPTTSGKVHERWQSNGVRHRSGS